MKQGWEIKKLGEVCKLTNGYAFQSKQYTDDGYFVIRIGNVQDGYIDLNNPRYIKLSEEKQKKFILSEGDILVSLTGNVGRVGTMKGEHLPAVLNQRVAKISIANTKLDKSYLFYFLKSEYFISELIKAGRGAAQQNISTTDIENLIIPLPPLPEQQRIVSILDEAFAAIDTAKANAEQNLKNAKELFESYLQGVFEKKGDGWEDISLKDISLEFARGKSKHRPRGDSSLLNGNYPLIQTGDISRADHWINEYSQTYNEKGLAQSKLWKKGTICIAIVGANVAETAILNFDACFPDSVIGVVVNPQKAENEYVDYLLKAFKSYLKEKGKGTARDNINLGTFQNQKFPFPSVQTQKMIVLKLGDLRAETQKLEAIYQQKLADLEELKKSVLQKAFSGELITKKLASII